MFNFMIKNKDFANFKDEALDIYLNLFTPVQRCILTSLVILVAWESNDRH